MYNNPVPARPGSRLQLDIIPNLLKKLEMETSLEFRLVNNKNINLLTGKPTNISEESLKLTFNNIPFPWKLVAIQPGYKKLESDAKREVIIYGFCRFCNYA